MGSWVYIEDIDEKYAPPEKPCLRVSVIDGAQLLSVAIVKPDPKRDMAYEEQAEVIVPLAPVLNALLASSAEHRVRLSHRSEDG